MLEIFLLTTNTWSAKADRLGSSPRSVVMQRSCPPAHLEVTLPWSQRARTPSESPCRHNGLLWTVAGPVYRHLAHKDMLHEHAGVKLLWCNLYFKWVMYTWACWGNRSIKKRDTWDLTALESLDRAAFHADAIDFSLPAKGLSQLFHLLLQFQNKLVLLLFVSC